MRRARIMVLVSVWRTRMHVSVPRTMWVIIVRVRLTFVRVIHAGMVALARMVCSGSRVHARRATWERFVRLGYRPVIVHHVFRAPALIR